MQQVQFKGSLKAFFDHVRNLDELKPFKTPEEVIENFFIIFFRNFLFQLSVQIFYKYPSQIRKNYFFLLHI